jgi:hypothetical protein
MGALIAATAAAIGSSLLTVYRVRDRFGGDTRSYDDFFDDVRVMNQNNSYFVAAIVIFLGFAVEGRLVPDEALVLLLVGLMTGSVSIFFYPVRKLDQVEAGPEVRGLWLFKVVATQWTVIFTVFGVSVVVVDRVSA